MERIGVFLCWCGANIASTVDVHQVVEWLRDVNGVAHAENYMYMCSDPGQELIKKAIREKNLTNVVVASCSPRMHEKTFRKAASLEGMNPYMVEIANVREQCSWVHQGDKDAATRKAFNIIMSTISKAKANNPLETIRVPITRRALVVGGGVAGMTAALELAEAGYYTALVERDDTLGGKMRRLSRTFPYHEDASAVIAPKIEELKANDNIKLYLRSDVTEVSGYVGNFQVTIETRPTEGEDGAPEVVTEEIGGIVLATGYDLYPVAAMSEYGGGKVPDVIDGLEFEELLKESLATGAPVKRPSDGKEVESVVFIQCSGSRDPEHHKPYCSRVCCLYTNKQATLLTQQNPGAKALISYMDIRTDCKLTEEYCQGNIEEKGLVYIRGRVSRLYREGDAVRVWTADTLTGEKLEIDADLVVLAMAIEPSVGAEQISKMFRAAVDTNGFLQESHIKLRPVESSTMGVYLAGAAQYPKDITDSVSQALATASKIQSMFASDELHQDPLVALVNPEVCAACGLCVPICPYGAREVDERARFSRVNEALCQGCGACVAICPNKACMLKNDTPMQVLNQIHTFLGKEEPAQ